ncbi:hypothetical protein GF325_04455 [Candidatus Bathyarchaeota archaeon]|nr:hypothetical protein [Candidatus Bathyarchaeota archaeon]
MEILINVSRAISHFTIERGVVEGTEAGTRDDAPILYKDNACHAQLQEGTGPICCKGEYCIPAITMVPNHDVRDLCSPYRFPGANFYSTHLSLSDFK